MKYEPKKVFVIEDGAYIELPYAEFCVRRESDTAYADKLMIPVHGMLMEVSKEAYESFYREKERIRYLRKLDREAGLLSLEVLGSERGSSEEVLPAEVSDIAELVAESLILDRLRECLRLLSDDELELIQQALGHKHIDTTIKYLNIVDDELLEASQQFYEKHSALYGIQELL